MARMHGRNHQAYLGERDISADSGDIQWSGTADSHDTTTYDDGVLGWKTVDPGLLGWSASVRAFYDPASGGVTRQANTGLGSDTAGLMVLSVYEDAADAIGDRGVLFSEARLLERKSPAAVADLMTLELALTGAGRVGVEGRLLHVLGAETATGSSSSLDNTASSANGGRGTVHITAITGTWTLKVQHSTDNSVWADLISFTAATAVGCQTAEVTGTVNRYLRADFTEDSAGSCTFAMGFARY